MSVPFAVTDLQEAVRLRCDLPTYDTNTMVTSAAILSFVQESARNLSRQLDDDDWYFVTQFPMTTVPGSPVLSLPTNFATLLRLHWVRDANTLIPLDQANLEDIPTNPSLTWEACAPRYRLTGDTVEFFPTPASENNLSMRYSTGAFLASAADTLMGQICWDTWIVYNCCCIVRQRQGKDYSEFAAERAQALMDIKHANRDRNGVKQPRDVHGMRFGQNMPWPTRWWGF